MPKVNKKGCAPSGDVCMAHHRPLECKHGCHEAVPHQCCGFENVSNPDAVCQYYGHGPDPRRQLP